MILIDHVKYFIGIRMIFRVLLNECKSGCASTHTRTHTTQPNQTPTWLCVQSAGSEEVGSEVDVNVAKEQQDILAPPPRFSAHLKAPATRELFIQLDQCKTPEPGLPDWTKCE